MFKLSVEYDEPNAKSRIPPSQRAALQRLFPSSASSSSSYTQRLLRIANDTKNNAARATAYVINEGQVDSARCFSYSKFKRVKSVWITPNGWRVATVACSVVFVCETGVRDDRMHYRFSSASQADEEEEDVVGQWHVNLQVAFASLEPRLTPRTQLTLSKLSKEILLGVHTDRVQRMLRASWERCKLGCTPALLAAALAMESNPQLDDYDPSTHAVILSKRARQQPEALPPPSSSVLSLAQLVNAVRAAGAKATPPLFVRVDALRELLYFIDAGLGCRFEHFVTFLGVVERCAASVWAVAAAQRGGNEGLSAYWHALQQQQHQLQQRAFSVDFLAHAFVFTKLMKRFPQGLGAMTTTMTREDFVSAITELPLAATVLLV